MKFTYKLSGGVKVSLDAETGESFSDIKYEGDEKEIKIISFFLESSGGMFGNQIGSTTTPNDLAVAMATPEMQAHSPELVEGEELLGDAPSNPGGDDNMF